MSSHRQHDMHVPLPWPLQRLAQQHGQHLKTACAGSDPLLQLESVLSFTRAGDGSSGAASAAGSSSRAIEEARALAEVGISEPLRTAPAAIGVAAGDKLPRGT